MVSAFFPPVRVGLSESPTAEPLTPAPTTSTLSPTASTSPPTLSPTASTSPPTVSTSPPTASTSPPTVSTSPPTASTPTPTVSTLPPTASTSTPTASTLDPGASTSPPTTLTSPPKAATSSPTVSTSPPTASTLTPTASTTLKPTASTPPPTVTTLPPTVLTSIPTALTFAPTTSQPTLFPTTLSPTRQPSRAPTPPPTPAPTPQPTSIPSTKPTGIPSIEPSAMPSQYPRAPVNGRVELMLRPVSGLIIGDTENDFLDQTRAFLARNLPQIESIQIEIERQARQQQNRRSLREGALFVDLRIRASRIIYSDTPFDFQNTVAGLFESSEQELVEVLKGTGDPYFEDLFNVILPDTSAPTAAPSNLPSASPEVEEDGLSQEYLIGIIAGGTFVLLVLLLFVFRCACTKRGKRLGRNPSSRFFFRVRSEDRLNCVSAGVGSDVESQQNLNSPAAAQSDGQSSYYGGSIMQNSTQMDANSYSYSLEPGIDPSVLSGKSTDSGRRSQVPMEIPQLGLPESDDQAMLQQSGIELAPSDLQLTQSELAMLPSGLGTSGDSPINELNTRSVVAPPGRLGIIIDTTVEGPVVHKINPGSALEGELSPGEIIVAIDDIDTRAMSASAITALMVKTANQERTLIVASNPN
eukprot:scaffold2563_cov124-Cylindrotheca_fusiformis.AAC.4